MNKFKSVFSTATATLVTTLIFALVGALMGVAIYVIAVGILALIFAGLTQFLISCIAIFGIGFAVYALILIVISLIRGEI